MKEYSIFTRTDFFGILCGEAATNKGVHDAYHDFIGTVIECCTGRNMAGNIHVALSFTEIELHFLLDTVAEELRIHARKALSFVRKMQEHISASHIPVPPLSNPSRDAVKEETTSTVPSLRWTGSTLDLVELIYGLNEMGCIDNGETPLKELAPALYGFFGLDTKECYRYYSAIKLRKNQSRTYFLDKMQAKLNEKIRRDEELERMRR